MKADHKRKGVLFWVVALALSLFAAMVSGYLFFLALFFIANAPPDYSIIFGIPVGALFFLFSMRYFGVKFDQGTSLL